jgi:hypothetical protein
MPLATATPPRPVDASVLRKRLAAVRGRLRFVHMVRGLGWVIGLTLLSFVVAGLLDFRWALPSLIRALLLVGSLVGATLVALVYLILPLTERTDDLTLALKIEENYPSLNDCLATAVQFMEQGDDIPEGESDAMRRQALRQTLQKASGCDFLRIVDTRGLRLAGLTGVLAVAAVVTLVLLYPTQSATAAVRLLDPFGDHTWPGETQLTIDDPPSPIAVNQPFEVKGTVRGVIPAEGKVIIRQPGFADREQLVKILKEHEDEGKLLLRLSEAQVQRSFEFQVKANDATSRWYKIAVEPPPTLGLLDGKPSPQVRLDYPAYTDLPSPRFLQPGIGHIEAITGTVVTLRGAADRPLKRAWLEMRYDATHLSALLPLGAGNALEGLAPHLLLSVMQKPIEGTLSDDGTKFSFTFRPLLAGEYLLHLENSLGLRGSRPYELRLRPDPAPLVQMERPSPTKDLLIALPGADLPVDVLVEDATFAIKSVFLRYRTQRDAPARKLVLYSEPMAWRVLGGLAGNGIGAQLPHYRPTKLEIRRFLSLKRIAHPDGSPLKDGDTLFLQACADDFDTVNPNKEPGASHEVEVKIVDRNRFELALNQEQGKIQQEILRQRERQREVLKQVQAFKNKADRGEKLTPEDQRALIEAEKQQGVIQDRIGTPKEGLRAEVNKLLETLKQNGMQNSAVRDRMADIDAELARLAEKELPKIQAALTEARKAVDRTDNPTERKESSDKLRREAQARLDRAEAMKRNDPSVLEKAADKLDKEAKEADNKGNPDKARELRNEADQERTEAKDLQKNPVDPDKKETKEEINRLEQQAKDLKDMADKLEQQPPMGKEEVQKNLADARSGQAEVDRTLTDLLARLEPWTNNRELQGEARKILQEQKELNQKAQQMEKEQGGKTPMQLTPEQKSDKNNLAEEQKKLEDRVNQLVQKMKNVADEREKKDPQAAKDLRDVAKEAQKENIAGKMKQARDEIDKNKLNDANKSQQAAAASLEKVIKDLKDRDEDQLDRLVKKMKEAEAQLEKLQDDLERLKKQRKEAEKIADAKKREEELKRLEKEQERLAQKGQQLQQQIQQLRTERGGKAMEQAAQKLEDAVKQLQRREQNEQAQEQALDRLAEAQEAVERAREQAEEELGREQLVRVMDTLKALKARQDARIADAKEIWDEAQQKKELNRFHQERLQKLGDAEDNLAQETGEVAKRDLEHAPVFARMVQRAADAMKEASERARKVAKEKPALAALPDEELDRLMALAARRLDQVIKAVQDEVDSPQGGQANNGGEQGQDMGGDAPKSQPGDHIPPLAQLKLLRVLEKDVRQQMTEFKKDHPDVNNLPDEKAKARYQAILKQRQDVRELFEELNRPADEPDARPMPKPDGKPEPKPEGGKP